MQWGLHESSVNFMKKESNKENFPNNLISLHVYTYTHMSHVCLCHYLLWLTKMFIFLFLDQRYLDK